MHITNFSNHYCKVIPTTNFTNYANAYCNVIRVICVIRSAILVVDELTG